MTTTAIYQLADRYRADEGRIFLSGVQALARLPVDQLRLDRVHGLVTAAFISGYQGSPVGMFGNEVDRASATVPDLPIVNRPGVNEELAASAVLGSQLAITLPDCRYDGVLGIWYGKGPGIDRASDAIRHAVLAGTSPASGVVAIVGDDPNSKSSTVPSASERIMADLKMPVLFPGDVQEALELGRHAVAVSRASGLWGGVKLVTPVADGTGTVELYRAGPEPVMPEIRHAGEIFRPQPNGTLLAPQTIDMEQEVFEVRLEVAREYGFLNGLNEMTVRSSDDWIGIAAAGYSYHEAREALNGLGFADDDDLRSAGIRLFQIRMPFPLDRRDVRAFAQGLTDIVVIEDKGPFLETAFRDALYDLTDRPRVWGKRDEDGRIVMPYQGMLDAAKILPALRHHLGKRLSDRLVVERNSMAGRAIPLSVNRAPFFCSGCPHNVSTRVAPGTLVGAGIGCHGMVVMMDPERRGDVVGVTCMGSEGALWIGISPFVERKHLVQNIGDGTFFHSGSLAVRASVAAGIDITYKLLLNGTVAMTGGQDAQGARELPDIAALLLAEGVAKIIVTSDEPARHNRRNLPSGVDLWDRSRLDEAHRVLAAIPGTTVLIHDQACAAEKRRSRSRGTLAKPDFRIVINERICEGCGDCGSVSNCLSVQPLDTPYGRKTTIDQSSCNFDMTCLNGDCPAFATVEVRDGTSSTRRERPHPPELDQLPQPQRDSSRNGFAVRLSGIGGTGVVTISQLIGTAALLEGLHVRGLDQTGLSQKAGPVSSDVIVTRDAPAASNHESTRGIDCLLAFDLLAAASDAHREGAVEGLTVVVGALGTVPTGEIVVNPNAKRYPAITELRQRLDSVSSPERSRYLDTAALTLGLFGSTISANVFALGVAVQIAAIPLEPANIEKAIELNGVAIAQNIAAFRFGRQWACQPTAVEDAARIPHPRVESLDELIARLEADLVDYQNTSYAKRFRSMVDRVRDAELRVGGTTSTALTEAAARNLHKLMAYKDEYEVARLAMLEESRRRYEALGGLNPSVTYHLHPPMLRTLGMSHKLKLKRSGDVAFQALRRMKRLRGTALDPFGHAEVRRTERALIEEYEAALQRILAALTKDSLEHGAAIASLPDQVRGYEHIKMRRVTSYRSELASELANFEGT